MMPASAARTVFDQGADWAWRRQGAGARRLAVNLRRVVGPELPEADFRALHRAALRSYGRYWREAFRLPGVPTDELRRTFVLENEDVLAAASARGRGVVVALPHSGNWDHAGAWAALAGYRPTAVAERLKPADLYDRFVAYRETLGIEVVPLTGGRPPLDVLTERLAEGRTITLLADRDLSARGVEVDFFGARTRMPAGPAVLALRTGAPLLVASLWYEPTTAYASVTEVLSAECGPPDAPLDRRVMALTQRVADTLASGIAQHPADWHMLQRLWLADLSARDPRRAAGPGADAPGLDAREPDRGALA
jgi:KDO2-lipid IV(A) lauroyltransferase